MIKVIIDREKILRLKVRVIKALIVHRAYIGYCWWVKEGNEIPLNYNDFKKFSFWKVESSFRIYMRKFKKAPTLKSTYLSFKNIILDMP